MIETQCAYCIAVYRAHHRPNPSLDLALLRP